MKSEEAHKALGPDWNPGNHPHFASVKPSKVEEVVEQVEEVVTEEAPKKRWSK